MTGCEEPQGGLQIPPEHFGKDGRQSTGGTVSETLPWTPAAERWEKRNGVFQILRVSNGALAGALAGTDLFYINMRNESFKSPRELQYTPEELLGMILNYSRVLAQDFAGLILRVSGLVVLVFADWDIWKHQ